MKKIYIFLSKSKTVTLMAKQEERPDRKSPGKQEPERRNWLLRLPVAGVTANARGLRNPDPRPGRGEI